MGLARLVVVAGEEQLDLAVGIKPNPHAAAIGQATEEQLVGQCAADCVLNKPLHRTRTHGRIKTFFGKMITQFLREHDINPFFMQLILKLHEELVDHTQDDLARQRSEEHTSELQSLMRTSYAVSCLKKNNIAYNH